MKIQHSQKYPTIQWGAGGTVDLTNVNLDSTFLNYILSKVPPDKKYLVHSSHTKISKALVIPGLDKMLMESLDNKLVNKHVLKLMNYVRQAKFKTSATCITQTCIYMSAFRNKCKCIHIKYKV